VGAAVSASAITVVVLLLVVDPSLWAGTPYTCNPPVPPVLQANEYVVVGCGGEERIGPDSYWVQPLARQSDDQTLYGHYRSTVAVASFLLNGTQVGELLAAPHPSGPPNGSFWSCAPALNCAVAAPIPMSPDVYSFVIENLGTENASVTFNETLLIAYLPSLGA
jgi:hypothetical protein